MRGNLRKELQDLNLNLDSVGEGQRRELEITESMIDDFCKIVYRAMIVTAEGYLYPTDIAINVFDDTGMDPYRKALDLGFTSFSAFLHSHYMTKYIDIDSSDDILSYHAIITPELLRTIGHIQREQKTAFLEMKRRPYPLRRSNAVNDFTDTISPQLFLKERMKKREALTGGNVEENECESLPGPSSSSTADRQNDAFQDEEEFEEIAEDDDFGLGNIIWRLDEFDDEQIIFCEPEGS